MDIRYVDYGSFWTWDDFQNCKSNIVDDGFYECENGPGFANYIWVTCSTTPCNFVLNEIKAYSDYLVSESW